MMRLTVSGQVLVDDTMVATTFWLRFKGLMGQIPQEGKGYLFPHTNSIHTLFMKRPITVLYLSRNGHVLRVTEEMKPWRIGPWVRDAWWTLELSLGGLTPAVGDVIEGLPENAR